MGLPPTNGDENASSHRERFLPNRACQGSGPGILRNVFQLPLVSGTGNSIRPPACILAASVSTGRRGLMNPWNHAIGDDADAGLQLLFGFAETDSVVGKDWLPTESHQDPAGCPTYPIPFLAAPVRKGEFRKER